MRNQAWPKNTGWLGVSTVLRGVFWPRLISHGGHFLTKEISRDTSKKGLGTYPVDFHRVAAAAAAAAVEAHLPVLRNPRLVRSGPIIILEYGVKDFRNLLYTVGYLVGRAGDTVLVGRSSRSRYRTVQYEYPSSSERKSLRGERPREGQDWAGSAEIGRYRTVPYS